MEKFYSKLDSNLLLHFIHRGTEFRERQELISEDEVLQLSSQLIPAGKSFPAHRHIPKSVNLQFITAQESWVVLEGKVKVSYFDTDDTLLAEAILGKGDTSVTLAGGHGYEALETCKVLEFKTGPYFGQQLDKVFIENK